MSWVGKMVEQRPGTHLFMMGFDSLKTFHSWILHVQYPGPTWKDHYLRRGFSLPSCLNDLSFNGLNDLQGVISIIPNTNMNQTPHDTNSWSLGVGRKSLNPIYGLSGELGKANMLVTWGLIGQFLCSKKLTFLVNSP